MIKHLESDSSRLGSVRTPISVPLNISCTHERDHLFFSPKRCIQSWWKLCFRDIDWQILYSSSHRHCTYSCLKKTHQKLRPASSSVSLGAAEQGAPDSLRIYLVVAWVGPQVGGGRVSGFLSFIKMHSVTPDWNPEVILNPNIFLNPSTYYQQILLILLPKWISNLHNSTASLGLKPPWFLTKTIALMTTASCLISLLSCPFTIHYSQNEKNNLYKMYYQIMLFSCLKLVRIFFLSQNKI